jgi:ATP-binding protein involved in chromosome partitioning
LPGHSASLCCLVAPSAGAIGPARRWRIYVNDFATRNAPNPLFQEKQGLKLTEPLIIRVRNALSSIKDPATQRSIVADGAVQGLEADEAGRVRFTLALSDADRAQAEELLERAKSAAQGVNGVVSVSAVATAHAPAKPARSPAGGHDNPFGLKRKTQNQGDALGDVKAVIAVASGKGGVGKSTVAANLAVAFARAGYRTGFLDADIYGPSAPTLFGVSGKAETQGGKVQPIDAHGVAVMSIGFLVDPEQALAWRGPMVMGALKQLMRDVAWGSLDVLIVDTPPGTGDAHLSLIQSKRLTGAVIVSTPQEMALADVRRGVQLFNKTDVNVVGVIENMAWLDEPKGGRTFLFGEGGAKKAAGELGVPFLGALPITPALREASDAGAPLAAQDHPAASAFAKFAKEVAEAIGL